MSMRSLRRLLVLFDLLLVAGLFGAGAWLVLGRPQRLPTWEPPKYSGAGGAELKPYDHYRLLTGLPLRPKKTIDVVQRNDPPVDPNLAFLKSNIQIKNVFPGPPGSINCSIRTESGTQEPVWFEGKTKRLGGRDVKLLRVDKEGGVFLLDGKQYRLSSSGVQAVGGAPRTGNGGGTRRIAGGDGDRAPAADKRYETTHRINDDKWLIGASEQDRVFNNISSYLNEVGLVPHNESGRTIGLRVTAIESKAYAFKLGFRQGDVITQVNTYELTSVQQIHQLKTDLRKAAALRIHYLRNGLPYRKVFKLRRE